MRSRTSRLGAGVALALAASLVIAAPSGAADQTVRCAGGSDFCTATVSVAGGFRDRDVTVRLTDTDLKLVAVTPKGAAWDRPYVMTDASMRRGGSEFRFTLDASEDNPRRARIVLTFAAGEPRRQPGLGSPRSTSAIFNVGRGMSVTIVGGGGGTSNCTDDETNETFTTTGDGDAHSFGFDSKGSGMCVYQMSWSDFKLTVKDPAGKVVGTGTMWFGQGETFGSYHPRCISAYSAPWSGINCDEAAGRLTIDRIY
jgi:hypothetical protein